MYSFSTLIAKEFEMEEELDDCDIIDLPDDSSEYALDTTDDEEEDDDHVDKHKDLEIDGQCRMEQTVYDLQYKIQNRIISNLDIEVRMNKSQSEKGEWVHSRPLGSPPRLSAYANYY